MRVLTVLVDRPTMAPTWRQIKSLETAGADIQVLDVKGTPKLKYVRALLTQRTLISEVDMIHAHYGYCGWLARSQLRKPIVVSFMGSDLLLSPALNGASLRFRRVEVRANRMLARMVDAAIVKSAAMANAIAPVMGYVVPNGVELDTFKPINRREAKGILGWDQELSYVLFPGNPADPNKGFDLARSAVQLAIEASGLRIRLVPLWSVKAGAVPLYMNACDAMLMTSFAEGSPNVVKEAMACNLPVVSVPVGDVREMVSGLRGYRICARRPELLGRELVRIVGSGERADGRAAVLRLGLDLDSVARRVLDIYETVLRRRHTELSRSAASSCVDSPEKIG